MGQLDSDLYSPAPPWHDDSNDARKSARVASVPPNPGVMRLPDDDDAAPPAADDASGRRRVNDAPLQRARHASCSKG
jgi:hypothetical protein